MDSGGSHYWFETREEGGEEGSAVRLRKLRDGVC